MTLVLKDGSKTAICSKCKSHMIYESEDIMCESEVYDTYGGEFREYTYEYIVCPICDEKIIINKED